MTAPHLLLITGLPATGKTTLARVIARRYAAALIAKDCVKEPLLDSIGAADAAASRRLSDASFAVLFALAHEQLGCGVSVVLEGNFRPREHAVPLRRVLTAVPDASGGARCAQVLCRVDEAVRRRRLAGRASDPERHSGHRDAEQLEAAKSAEEACAFLDIPGSRFVWEGIEAADTKPFLHALDRWWSGSPDDP
jgi:predicted kinase